MNFESQAHRRQWMIQCRSGSPGRSHKRNVWKSVGENWGNSVFLGITFYYNRNIFLCLSEAHRFVLIFKRKKLFSLDYWTLANIFEEQLIDLYLSKHWLWPCLTELPELCLLLDCIIYTLCVCLGILFLSY